MRLRSAALAVALLALAICGAGADREAAKEVRRLSGGTAQLLAELPAGVFACAACAASTLWRPGKTIAMGGAVFGALQARGAGAARSCSGAAAHSLASLPPPCLCLQEFAIQLEPAGLPGLPCPPGQPCGPPPCRPDDDDCQPLPCPPGGPCGPPHFPFPPHSGRPEHGHHKHHHHWRGPHDGAAQPGGWHHHKHHHKWHHGREHRHSWLHGVKHSLKHSMHSMQHSVHSVDDDVWLALGVAAAVATAGALAVGLALAYRRCGWAGVCIRMCVVLN